jgi:hypothetical protein
LLKVVVVVVLVEWVLNLEQPEVRAHILDLIFMQVVVAEEDSLSNTIPEITLLVAQEVLVVVEMEVHLAIMVLGLLQIQVEEEEVVVHLPVVEDMEVVE